MSHSNNLRIYTLGHSEESLKIIPNHHAFKKVNLNDLVLPIANTNDLAENRFFLLDESYFHDCPEYIGVLTAQYEKKYPALIKWNKILDLQNHLNPEEIFAASPTELFNEGKWVEWSFDYHKTIKPYLEDIANFAQIPLSNNPTFWANNFICHKRVFFEFIKFFKKIFNYMHPKYGFNFAFKVDDTNRTAAYLYERVSMLWFSNKDNLKISKIPDDYDWSSTLWIATSATNYEELTSIWHESLMRMGIQSENISHNIIDIPKNINAKVKFQADVWYYCIQKKIEYLIEVLKGNLLQNKYKYFISTDCDIQYFFNKNHMWKLLFNYIDTTDFDIYFQPEDNVNICGGFYIVKKDNIKKIIDFLEKVITGMKIAKKSDMPYADQTIMKNLMNTINSCVLPPATCVQGPAFVPEYKKTYLFHHAICAYDKKMKLAQMEYIKKLMDY